MAKVERVEGVVKWFNAEKGYGFLRLPNGREVFVHHTGINASGFRTLEPGENVTFIMEPSKTPGKFQAIDVQRADPI